VLETVAVDEQYIPVATVVGKQIVAVSILVEVGRKETAGADKSETSTASGGRGVVAMLMGSLDHQGRSKAMGANAIAAQPAEVG